MAEVEEIIEGVEEALEGAEEGLDELPEEVREEVEAAVAEAREEVSVLSKIQSVVTPCQRNACELLVSVNYWPIAVHDARAMLLANKRGTEVISKS